MSKYSVLYHIHDDLFQYEVEGTLAAPEDVCMLEFDDDLTKKCGWADDGYSAVTAWGKSVSDVLQESVKNLIYNAAGDRKLNFVLQNYHNSVNDNQHLAIIESLKELPRIAQHFIPTDELDRHISNILGINVSCYSQSLQVFGCNIRIVRPNRNDNNPLHKDVWLDRLRHCINLYIPIAGSNHLSSLSLIPKSHHWSETDICRTTNNCVVNGVSFTVPSVITSNRGLRMTRPDLKNNEILIFSPYLIHGGACNLNENATRISLEIRFWRKY